MKEFSSHWKSSKKPKKQRKYRYNAPLHIKQRFVNAHLSKELMIKHKRRSLGLKKGDKVKIVRGKSKNKEGKVEKINLKREHVFISGTEITKKDGTKTQIPIHPSNLIIIELNLDDKKRQKIWRCSQNS